MRLVSLAGTQLSTSRLGFGTSGIHQILRSSVRQNLLAAAFDSGIRHFDTSPFYGHGIAERELGKFLRGRRDAVQIATKFGVRPNPVLGRVPGLLYAQLAANAAQRKFTKRNVLAVTPRRDYGAAEACASLDRSLRALGTDYVDIFFLHDPKRSYLAHVEELLVMLERLRRDGKARYIGLAGSAIDCIELALRYPAIAALLQINAAPGVRELDLVRAASLPCHFSFGHFRDKTQPMRSLLDEAVRHNPEGVILFSSRRPARIAQVLAQLAQLEPC
jgi:aryl-alcohol dehydrogenase-like predicted oxidoreductase